MDIHISILITYLSEGMNTTHDSDRHRYKSTPHDMDGSRPRKIGCALPVDTGWVRAGLLFNVHGISLSPQVVSDHQSRMCGGEYTLQHDKEQCKNIESLSKKQILREFFVYLHCEFKIRTS